MSEITGDMAKKLVPILMNEIERLKAELAALKGKSEGPTTMEIVEGLIKDYKDSTGSNFTTGGDVKDGPDFKYVAFTECPKFTDKHKSAMAKYTTPELWAKLKDAKTSKGYTLSNAVQTGCLIPHLGVGCTAGDEESWTVFKDLYYPVIKDWHAYDAETQKHPTDLDHTKLKFSDEQKTKFEQYVASTRIRAARNISGFALPCGATDDERKGVEDVVSGALTSITDPDLKGTYYKLGELSDEQTDFLLNKGYLFQIPTARNLLMGAGAARNWPNNRGIFHNDNQTALAWCNEEDHCRIISMKDGGDIPDVFMRFGNLSKALEATGAKLMWNETLGYMGTCPSNLGTGLRASVMIQLKCFNAILEDPKSSHEDKELLEQVCSQFDLQPRGSAGEHSPAKNAKFDVSNKQRLGFSEVELVQKMIDGVTKLIELEEMLAGGASPADVRAKAGIN
jgi:creatine kinase